MNSTKLSAFCDKVLEIGWLLAVIITPLFFNVHSSRVFEPDKLTALRTVAVVMASVWLVKLIEERASGRNEIGFGWRTPLVLPTLFTASVYLLSTLLSITPRISFLGSYQRLQGTYTTYSYIVIFLVIVQGLRTRAQLNRLLTVIILNSLPISLYGLIQRNELDPLPWGGDVTKRVAANMGNPIFVAAYLIMVLPLTIGRIATSFKAILTDEHSNWADILRASGYIFIAAIEIIATWYAQSRGPLLGLIAGSYFLFLLLALSARSKTGAATVLAIVAATAVVVSLLVAVNIPKGPLQSLQRAPWLGRLGEVFDFEGGTGKVRALIWEGMVDLILPHRPISYPDGHVDPLHRIRPLIGYGPESIYVAYNGFYPPLLGQYESRTASPDRSHNETLDALAITGLLGLVAYLWLFISLFYASLKWLGLVRDKRWRNLLFGLVGGFSICSVAFFSIWQGLHFFGAALTLGIVSGLGAYLAIVGVVSAADVLRSKELALPSPHPHQFLIISLIAVFVSHFIEINFGIAIASTRTTFWACAGVLVVAGTRLVVEQEENTSAETKRSTLRSRSAKRRRKRSRAPSAVPPTTRATLPRWLGPTLAAAVLGGFITGTLFFDFVTNSERLSDPFEIVWRTLTVLPAQDGRTSFGTLMIFALTSMLSVLIFITEMDRGGAFRERPRDWPLAVALYVTASTLIGLGFALVLAGRQASAVGIQAQTMEDLVRIADKVAGFLSAYYGFILFALVAGGIALFVGRRRLPKVTAHPWGILASIIVAILAWAITLVTNLTPIQADIVYKYGNPYERPEQRLLAIEHYQHAIELAPKEDQYYLFLAMPYLEYAATHEDPAVRDTLLRKTEQILTQARAINPLQTDHSRNLAVLYMRWVPLAADTAQRARLTQLSDENFELATMLSPQNVLLWNRWATFYLQTGNLEQAQEKITTSLELNRGFDESWMIQADLYTVQNRLDEALEAYQQALELNPGLTNVWTQIGSIYAQLDRPDEAIAAYEKTLEINPRLTDGWLRLGDTLHGQNRLEEAALAYERALELQPDHVLARRVLGSVYAQLGRFDEAAFHLEQALEVSPEAADAWDTHRVLAVIYSQLGQNSVALSHALSALELAPEDQQPGLEEMVTQLEGLPGGT